MVSTNQPSPAHVQHLFAQVEADPWKYESHLALISALRSGPSSTSLRNAREAMAARFPLTPDLWLQWTSDEKEKGAESHYIDGLFHRATQDYVSDKVWLEYVQWKVGTGVSHTEMRGTFEAGLAAVGTQASNGSLLWEAYRVWESVLLSLAEDAAEKEAAISRVHKLFRRQLALPLRNIHAAWGEYQEFVMDYELEIDPEVEQKYEAAQERLDKEYEDLEAGLDEDETELKYPAFKEYIDHEEESWSEKDPSRVVSIFERALIPNCLNHKLWLRYLVWLDKNLRIHDLILSVYKRALRNVPWSAELWSRYLAGAERGGRTVGEVEAIFEEAREAAMTEVHSSIMLWLHFIYILQRLGQTPDQIHRLWKRGRSALEEVFGVWDPDMEYRSRWADWLGETGFLAEGRVVWDELLGEGRAASAYVWLSALQFEFRQRLMSGEEDWARVRELFRKGLNSVTDEPDSLMAAWLRFEHAHGAREDLDSAMERIDLRQQQLKDKLKTSHERGHRSEKRGKRKRRRRQEAEEDIDTDASPLKSEAKDAGIHGWSIPLVILR